MKMIRLLCLLLALPCVVEAQSPVFVDPAAITTLKKPSVPIPSAQKTELLQLDLEHGRFSSNPRPKVGHYLKFEVVHYNPYRDSMRLEVDFRDFYPNAEAKFVEAVQGATGTAKGTNGGSPIVPSTAKTFNLDTPQGIKDLLSAFADELKQLYTTLYTLSSIDLPQLDRTLAELDGKIGAQFDLSTVTATSIDARGLALIEKAKFDADEKTLYTRLLKEGIVFYNKLNNYHRLDFLPDQVQNKDYTELKISLKRDQGWHTPRSLTFHNRWGGGFGYSIGFMGTPLRDFSYALRQVSRVVTSSIMTDSLVYRDSIMRVESGNFNLGALTLGHFYTRIPAAGINLAVSTGIGVNGQLDGHYFLGASVMFGRKRQFVLSGGCVFAKVNRLEARYREDELLPIVTGQTNAVSTREVWDRSWFLAITLQP